MTFSEGKPQGSFSLKQQMSSAVLAACVILLFEIVLQLMPVQEPALSVLGLCAALAIGIVVHELGHVAGALAVGFSIFSFTAGPITLRRESGGLRLRIANFRIGGMITAVPVGSHNLRRRILVLTIGGPVGSVIGGGFEFALGSIFHNYAWSEWMLPLALVSCGLGLISIVPVRRFYVSDGARILELVRDGSEADRICARLAIAASAFAGTRPKDWDRTLIEKTLNGRNDSGDHVIAMILAYELELDSHHFDAAEDYLQAAIANNSKCPPNIKSAIAADAAFFQAAVRNNSTAAREWLEKCHARHIEDGYVLPMVEAAVLTAEGRAAEAENKLALSVALLPKARFPGFASAAQEWIATIRERIQAQKKCAGVSSGA